MSEDLKVEYFLRLIREKLNNDKIKLWLPPYHLDEKSEQEDAQFEALEKLAVSYSEDLKIDKNICITALKELQKHALDKLHEKEVYNETGVAVIKVKLSGCIPVNNNNNNNNPVTTGRILSIHICLKSFTDALEKAVSEQINIPPERIKLISSGKVLNNKLTLENQGLKHGLQIMAVILSANSSDLQDYEKRVEMLERTKDDVRLLADRFGPGHDTYLQVADQSGKTLNLPAEEQKALVTAMALHEKGRAALKKDEYALALVFLLEADKEFSNCNSQLLNSVDNYALLNLDIAWCYLCLKNVTQLPDAEKRLKVCESKFKYSYGPNLERLVALKGSSGNEAALLMRLHLLQGIVLFHQNKHDEARQILKEAQRELSVLKVDDASLCSLIELGLTPAEARLALRATKGCVNSAVEYTHQKRREKEDLIKKEKEEKEKRKLGFCKDGKQYVEPSLVSQLETMGFVRSIAIAALKHSNNDLNDAINVIHQQPELLTPSFSSLTDLSGNFDHNMLMELIQQVVAMGYDPSMAQQALKNNNGDIKKAVEQLIASGGTIPVPVNEGSPSCSNVMTVPDMAAASTKLLNSLIRLNDRIKKTSKDCSRKRKKSGEDESGAASGISDNNELPSTSNRNGGGFVEYGKRLKKAQEAFDRFSEGINTSEDDHLDLTLEQEEEFLTQYLSLLI